MEHIIKQQEMESLKALADLNLKISQARNLLTELEEQETEYLIGRETKAVGQIKQALEKSKSLLEEANLYSEEVRKLANLAGDIVSEIMAYKSDFLTLSTNLVNWISVCEKDLKEKNEAVEAVRTQLSIEKIKLENDKKSLETAKREMDKARRKIESDRGMIQRTIERLKKGKI